MPVIFLAVAAALLSEPTLAKWALIAYGMLVFGRVLRVWR